MIKYIFIILFIPSIVFAEIENARDLMEAGKFKEAMEELMPAARSGNADAEELIGIMYAMGLGVEQDDVRALTSSCSTPRPIAYIIPISSSASAFPDLAAGISSSIASLNFPASIKSLAFSISAKTIDGINKIIKIYLII